MNAPVVTVFMAVYNGANFLRASIESILAQTFTDFELLIVNDGSTDNSLSLISSFLFDSRVRLLDNSTNRGILYSRNLALKEARGEYLAIMDCDDIALPDRLEIQYQFLSLNKEFALCGGHAKQIDENGNSLKPPLVVVTDNKRLAMHLLFGNVFVHSSVMVRTVIFREVGGYHNFNLAEDYHFFWRISQKYAVANLDNFLVKYRLHPANTSLTAMSKMLESERAILLELHEKIGIMKSQSLIDIHHSILKRNLVYSYSDYRKLLIALKKANSRTGLYPPEDFNRFIFDKWFFIIELKGGKESLLELLHTDMLEKWNYLSLKKIRRAVKKALLF